MTFYPEEVCGLDTIDNAIIAQSQAGLSETKRNRTKIHNTDWE